MEVVYSNVSGGGEVFGVSDVCVVDDVGFYGYCVVNVYFFFVLRY